MSRRYYSGPVCTWEQGQWRGAPHFPKLLHHWNLTIRLFSVISRTLIVVGVLLLCRDAVGVFLQPKPNGQYTEITVKSVLFQTIQFSTQFKCQNRSISPIQFYMSKQFYFKQFYFKHFSLASLHSLNFISTQVKCKNSYIKNYSV